MGSGIGILPDFRPNYRHLTTHSNMNVTNVHPDGADPKTQDSSGKRSFFRLPAEIRLIVWRILVPGERIISVRGRYGVSRKAIAQNITPARIKQSSHEPRWFLRPFHSSPGGPQNPVLLEICQESRDFALQHGSFAFQGSQVEDTGMWWNSSVDVLAFEEPWSNYPDLWAFVGLKGLENIRHVALSSSVAGRLDYVVRYRHEQDKWRLRDPLIIGFAFLQYPGTPHVVPEFFNHIVSLTIFFDRLRFDDDIDRVIPGCSRLHHDGLVHLDVDPWCPAVTFQLGSEINTAVRQLETLKRLFLRDADLFGAPEIGMLAMRGISIPVQMSPCIVYGIKDGIDPSELDNSDELRSVVTMGMMVENDEECF